MEAVAKAEEILVEDLKVMEHLLDACSTTGRVYGICQLRHGRCGELAP